MWVIRTWWWPGRQIRLPRPREGGLCWAIDSQGRSPGAKTGWRQRRGRTRVQGQNLRGGRAGGWAPVAGVACTAAGAERRQRVRGQGRDTRVLEGLKDENVLRITPESLACVKTMRSQQRVFSREVTRWGLGGKGHFECSARLTLDSFSGNLCCGPPQKATAAEKVSSAVPSSPKPLGSKQSWHPCQQNSILILLFSFQTELWRLLKSNKTYCS